MDGTSFYDLISGLQEFRTPLLIAMVLLPVITWIAGKSLTKMSKEAGARFLSIPVFLSVIPGTCCVLAVAYLILVSQVNILRELDLVLGVGPIVCMIVTLIAISKIMHFDAIPGFDRLSGLIMTVAVSFVIILIVVKTRIFVGLFASIRILIVSFIALFLFLHIGISRLTGKD